MPVVKFFAGLRKIAGTKETSLPGSSIAELVAGLIEWNPALASHLLENGQLRQHVIITVNGNPTMDLGVLLKEDDQIAIFPPIAGG